MDLVMIDNPIPKTREEAKLLGAVAYFTGDKCQNSHIDKRYTNTGICYACKRDINKRNQQSNSETCKAIQKRTYNKNREKRIAESVRWAKRNIEKTREIKRRNKEKHKEKYREAERIRVKEKLDNDPEYHLYKRMSKSVWGFLKSDGTSKDGNKWISLVDYEINDLRFYLESQFDDHMTWENYGSYWHVDHIVPRSFFLSHELKDRSYLFQCCWSLENLRPLKADDNLSKGHSIGSRETKTLIKKFNL